MQAACGFALAPMRLDAGAAIRALSRKRETFPRKFSACARPFSEYNPRKAKKVGETHVERYIRSDKIE